MVPVASMAAVLTAAAAVLALAAPGRRRLAAAALGLGAAVAGAVVAGIGIPLRFDRVAGIFGRVLEAAVFRLELGFNLVRFFRVHGLQFSQESEVAFFVVFFDFSDFFK